MSSRRATGALLLALFALGLLVRALGIRLGLPFYHHWDECWLVASARSMLERGNDVPTSYQYGAPLSRLIVLAVKANERLHLFPLVAYKDEVALRWVGRVIVVALNSTGTLALYLAGRAAVPRDEASSRRAGLYAAALYAFAYELVCHGRFVVTDAGLVTFCAWSLGFCGQYLRSRKLAWAIAAVLAAGVAFAFKPTALPTILIPALTLMFVEARPPRPGIESYFRRGLLMGIVPLYFACFFFFNPHYIDHWSEALRDLSLRIAQMRNGGLPWFMLHKPGIDHLSIALWGLAGHTLSHDVWIACLLTLVAALGLVVAVRRRTPIVLIAAAHAGLTVVVIAWPNKAYLLRNNLVAVPAMCLAFAVGMEWLSRALESRWGRTPRSATAFRLAPIALVLLSGGATLRDAFKNQSLSVDARLRASAWLAESTAGTSILVAFAPTVSGHIALGASEASHREMVRPGMRLVGEVASCAALARLQPDYAITASTRGTEAQWYPYIDVWPLRECPGYTEVATFEANPYEHTYWSTETWDGRASAAVLKRVPRVEVP